MFKQISVFIENKPGRLEEVTGYLAEEKINIHALSIADTHDFGILRIIVSEPDRTEEVLKSKGLMVKTTGVVAVGMENAPGSLHKILRELRALDISIEYMYAFTSRHMDYDAIVILRLNNQDAVVSKLRGGGINVLGQELLDRLCEN